MFTGISLIFIGACRLVWPDDDEPVGASLTRTLSYAWVFAAFVITAHDIKGWL